LLKYAQQADEAGFDLLDVSDHFNPWDPEGQASFAWTWLGAVAATTARIHIGTGLTCPILRYNPAIVAQASATLEAMAPGRTYLSVGTGEALNEFPTTGVWPSYTVRQRMLAKAIEVIRQLWSGEEVSLRGEYFDLRHARLFTRPSQPPPLYVSSMVPGSSRFAGTHGDALLTTGVKPDVLPAMFSEFEEGQKAAGKDGSRADKMIEVQVGFSDNKEPVLTSMKRYWAGAMLPALFNKRIYRPEDSAMNGEAVGKDVLESKMCISTDPQEHARFLGKYLQMGFTTVIVHCPGPDQPRFIEAYGRDVLPLMRESKAAA